jgi:hypothetical protein
MLTYPAMSNASEASAILEVNAAFYRAFEERDLASMASVWEQSERAFCVHPGWPPIVGWSLVSASWFSLFNNTQRLQFITTSEQVGIEGSMAWVLCHENILSARSQSVNAATNLFCKDPIAKVWRLVAHIGLGLRQGVG